ncbi:MAG: DUF2169 domain-containing protein [Desulfovibrionaceae bacterium]|nr:DUF2169 domain-containing protein [Desulfovibrionaceae bacterium]
MKQEIPETLSLNLRPIVYAGEMYQAVTVSCGFDLLSFKLCTPDRSFAAAMAALENSHVLDLGLPKKQAEWLLAGAAYAGCGGQVQRLTVDMQVCDSKRKFLIEAAEPFASFKFSWTKTYQSQDNPIGVPQTQITRAPIIDYNLPHGHAACPLPMGNCQSRQKYLGTYDAKWLQTCWPGLAKDFDFTYCNLAQECQRLPALHPKATFAFTNLHPKYAEIHGHVPDLNVTLFVQRGHETHEHRLRLDTLWFFPNQLTGLLLWHGLVKSKDEAASDVDCLRVELLGDIDLVDPQPQTPTPTQPQTQTQAQEQTPVQAQVQVQAQTQAQAQAQAEVPEPPKSVPKEAQDPLKEVPIKDAPPTAQSLQQELNKTLDENLADINKGLQQANLPPLSEAQIEATRAKFQKIASDLQALEAKMQSQAPVDPDPHMMQQIDKAINLPFPDPTMFKTEAAYKVAIDKYLASFNDILHPSAGMLNNLRNILHLEASKSFQPPVSQAQELAEQVQILMRSGFSKEQATGFFNLIKSDIPKDFAGIEIFAQKVEQVMGLPTGSIAKKIRDYQATLNKLGFLTADDLTSFAKPEEKISTTVIKEAAAKVKDTSFLESPQSTAEPHDTPHDRESLLAWIATGKSLSGLSLDHLNLDNLDLENQDLQNVDLSFTSLKGAHFTSVNLSGAKLVGTDLSAAILTDVLCSNCHLDTAILNQALCHKVNFASSTAKKMIAKNAVFEECGFEQANVQAADFTNATFTKTQACNCQAKAANFSKAKLRFADFSAADFQGAIFKQADVHGSILTKANLAESNFEQAALCYETNLEQASFVAANLVSASLTHVQAIEANFSKVQAAQALCTDSNFQCSNWKKAALQGCDFSRSNLKQSNLTNVNLFGGSLRSAQINGAIFAYANLYGVDMAFIQSDPTTIWDGADCTNTILDVRKNV